VTPAGEVLAEEIERDGPIAFRRFMEVALYHPQHGYYRRTRLGRRGGPFGRAGDFFTAEQIQPVFGILMAARVRQLYRALGEPADFTVVELGAGRCEMAPAFAEWRYVPIDIDSGELPEKFRGVAFSNEFFDALPVDVAIALDGEWREQRVGWRVGRFVWETAAPVSAALGDYLARFGPPPEDGRIAEVSLSALEWLERVAGSMDNGYLLTIDYGYRRAELIRFPAGTLMSYGRHQAADDVLHDPGERDISAHVNFTALEEHGAAHGWRTQRFETLAQTILSAGEADQFASALAAQEESEALRRRMQLKTLLVGMGETFRVLLQRREGTAENRREPNRREKPETMKKAPKIGALEWNLLYAPLRGRAQATSFSSEQLSSSGRLSWLRSSSIDSP
jgi:SAM-dependent MidA family methyltransferase